MKYITKITVLFSIVILLCAELSAKKGYPKVERQDNIDMVVNDQVTWNAVRQDKRGNLHYTYTLNTTKALVLAEAHNIDNVLAVMQQVSLGEIARLDPDLDASTKLFFRHGKSWTFNYYDINGERLGSFSLNRAKLNTMGGVDTRPSVIH